MSEKIYWIWLSLAVTPGSLTFSKLISKFSTAESIYRATEDEIIRAIGSKSQDFKAVTDKSLERAESVFDFCARKGVGILTYDDDKFPSSLKKIATPPVLLYYRGVLPDFNSECFVSVVGTRRLTDYGRKNAFSIANDLSRAGAIIVSGMAVGVDGVALCGALVGSGRSVAVLGSGIDVCYPEAHKTLARGIVKHGCVMTEYAPGTKPSKWNFPKRNRLISGLSCATVVIEGADKSGAIITARYAREQERALYALPGNVDIKTSEISNVLIKTGAKLVTDAYDIVSDFEFLYLGKLNPFRMAEPSGVRMFDCLREYEVACVTPSDDVFRTPKKRREKEIRETVKEEYEITADSTSVPEDRSAEIFDKWALEVYKRIPTDVECDIEELVLDGEDVRTVMKALLTLDMGNFVDMLPGEQVRRKRV